jgi:multidrug transporter EmrE-like cation transporter
MSYFYVALTILLTAFGQIAIKWQVLEAGELPVQPDQKIIFLAKLMINPWVMSAFLAALLASVSWMAAMTKLQLSHAYPFMSVTFVLVMVLSAAIFHEPITLYKVAGIGLVIAGLVVGSQG